MKQPSWSRTGEVGCFFSQQPSSRQTDTVALLSKVEQFRTRDKMFSALLLSFRSDAETQHEAIESNLKKILLHALLYRGGWFPLHLTLFLLWAMGHTCLCYREFQRENGFMTCSWAHAFSVASQSRHRVSCLFLEAVDFVRHRSSLFFFFTFGSVTLVYLKKKKRCMNVQYYYSINSESERW